MIEQVEVKTTSTTRNVNRVPVKQWAKWSPTARRVFNATHLAMTTDQDLFLHPKATPLPNTQWSTTAWNAAWIAAEAV
jgi:hypothetical protein